MKSINSHNDIEYTPINNNNEIKPLIESFNIESTTNYQIKNSKYFSFYVKILILICTSILLLIVYVLLMKSLTVYDEIILMNSNDIKHNSYINIYDINRSLYLKYIKDHNKIVFQDSIPYLHGSSFKLHRTLGSKCFRLKSSNQKWLSLDYKSGLISANSDYEIFGVKLAAVLEKSDYNCSINCLNIIKLRLCDRNAWIESIQISTNPAIYQLYINPKTLTIWGNIFKPIDTKKDAVVIQANKQNQLIGVNLGGWFIPEVWMRRSFFNNTGLGWGGSLCAIVKYNRTLAEERTMNSLNNWITELDIKEIASIGYNSLRLPIGYWNVIDDPYKLFAPANVSISLSYIHKLFQWADKYDLSVMIDLHGAPGSQNGIDHSGCNFKPKFIEQSNIDLSLQAIESILINFKSYKSLIGIELVNEPSYQYSKYNHTQLVNYYNQSYHLIRRYDKSLYVVFNELYSDLYDNWINVFNESDYYNVVLDLHLYDWQFPYTNEKFYEHIRDAEQWKDLIDKYSKYFPIVVGEWSMSTGTYMQVGELFVKASVNSFESSAGWYLWNWKIEKNLNYDEWDVQLQYERIQGLNPLKYLT